MNRDCNASAKLDWTRLLGFDQVIDRRDLVRDARLTGKVGEKVGEKIGDKGGVKDNIQI